MQETHKMRSDLWVRKIPWRRKWQPIPLFLNGKFNGQGSLMCYSPWDHRVRHDVWKIPWAEEPGSLQSMGLQRFGHDWATSLHFTSIIDLRHTLLIAHPSIHSFLTIFLNNWTLNLSKVYASSFPDSQWSGNPYAQVLTKEMKKEFIGCNSQALFLETTSADMLLGSLTFILPFLSFSPASCT